MESSVTNASRGKLELGLPSVLGRAPIPGWRGECLILAFFLLATIALTWPIAISMSSATGLRGDYFNNLWNVWWLRHAITEGVSPFQTEYLYYPEGLSLWRHTLSPINALVGVGLSSFLGPHTVFNTVLLLNFLFSAWAFSLFARYLTGSTAGAVLGGLLYSFNPFHYYYICQVNVFSLGWLPLALLYFVRVYRDGGRKNMLLAALFTGCIAGTAEYYVMYAVISVGLMLVFGKLLDPRVVWSAGVKRLLVTGALTGLTVVAVAWPLLYGTFGPHASNVQADLMGLQGKRANDLFGFEWVGGPEGLTVSWPTMLGYSTLLLLALFLRRVVARQRFWIVLGAVFFLLGLGKELAIGREPTGIPLLYQFLGNVPGLDMLRKPDRAFLMVQLVVALLLAEAWVGLRERLTTPKSVALAWGAACALPMIELTGVPFSRFSYEAPAHFEELARQEDVLSVVECPPMFIDVMNARYNYFQMTHGKKQPLGYSTLLAKGNNQQHLMDGVINSYLAWLQGLRHEVPDFPVDFPSFTREYGYDRIIVHKTMSTQRATFADIHDRVVFEPFFLVRSDLVRSRQIGQFVDKPIDAREMDSIEARFRAAFGAPVHEDEDLLVFDPRSGQ